MYFVCAFSVRLAIAIALQFDRLVVSRFLFNFILSTRQSGTQHRDIAYSQPDHRSGRCCCCCTASSYPSMIIVVLHFPFDHLRGPNRTHNVYDKFYDYCNNKLVSCFVSLRSFSANNLYSIGWVNVSPETHTVYLTISRYPSCTLALALVGYFDDDDDDDDDDDNSGKNHSRSHKTENYRQLLRKVKRSIAHLCAARKTDPSQ